MVVYSQKQEVGGGEVLVIIKQKVALSPLAGGGGGGGASGDRKNDGRINPALGHKMLPPRPVNLQYRTIFLTAAS